MADYENQSDAQLMKQIQTRDVDAFDALRLRYESNILRHLMSIVHNSETAQDLLQETLLRLWTHSQQWEGQGSVKSWLLRISTNLALNTLRSTTRRKETPLEGNWNDDEDSLVPGWMIDSITPGPSDALESAERSAMLRKLVDELPEEKRELIRLVYEAEMDVKEAAEALGIPEGTAKSRLHYSAKYLAREWRNHEEQ